MFSCGGGGRCRNSGSKSPAAHRGPPGSIHTHTHTHACFHLRNTDHRRHFFESRSMHGRACSYAVCFFFFFLFGADYPTEESCRMAIKFTVQEGNLICKRSSCLSAKGLRRLNCNIRIIRKFANIKITHKLYTMQTFAWEVTFYWIWIPNGRVAKN
jgi:hypothetical protein